MASVTPKLRSRKDGAAVPLDEFDRRLLNTMQGAFPIEPRPYAAVGRALDVPEERVLALFRHKGATAVIRYELPNLRAFNFVIDNALEGGVNASLCQDLHGKTLSFLLLGEITVTLPRSCLPEGSPYQ